MPAVRSIPVVLGVASAATAQQTLDCHAKVDRWASPDRGRLRETPWVASTGREDEERGRLYWEPLSDAEGDAEPRHVVSGPVIRLMWDHTVEIPLWDAEGLLPEDPVWLHDELGLSPELIHALTTWSRDADSVLGEPDEDSTPSARLIRLDLDREARRLVDVLRRELGSRYDVEYHPL